MNKNVYDYIISEKVKWKTERIPLTNSKDWNMSEHIERCTNVANAWFHNGQNDGLRPYDDLVTPVIDVAFRSEGFDVKDIVFFIDDIDESYKSLLIKKFHPEWATKNQLDQMIDDMVETSIIYDLVLIKDINNVKPEVVDLKTIAFCDQSDIMSGPICLKHYYTISELTKMKGMWSDDEIDKAILLCNSEKEVSTANDKSFQTPGKYIEVYELRGELSESWLKDDGDKNKFIPQMHIVCFYIDSNGNKNGITLYKGKDELLEENFFALKIDRIRSKGRACGRSIVERLFEPQVWNNYSAIKLKKMMDSAVNLLQSDSLEIENQKIEGLPEFTILKTDEGKSVSRVDMGMQNTTVFTNYQEKMGQSARLLGSASEASLGINPSSGTPFALQDLVVQQGQGIHEYRQGKIASFFSDVLYPKLILPYLTKEMSNPKKFSEELSLDEITEIAETISRTEVDKKIKEIVFKTGRIPTEEEREVMVEQGKKDIISGKTSYYKNGIGFFELLKDDIKDIPIKVKVNIASKQKYLAREADKLSKFISMVIQNPQAFASVPGLGKSVNQLIESSGMNPIDFSQIIKGVKTTPDIKTKQLASPVEESELEVEKNI